MGNNVKAVLAMSLVIIMLALASLACTDGGDPQGTGSMGIAEVCIGYGCK